MYRQCIFQVHINNMILYGHDLSLRVPAKIPVKNKHKPMFFKLLKLKDYPLQLLLEFFHDTQEKSPLLL